MSELNAYALLVLVGFLPSEMWRVLGFVAARRIADESEFFIWARSVAIAVLAGVIAKIILFPPGALASVPLSIRLCATAVGFSRSSLRADRSWRAWRPARPCSSSARSRTGFETGLIAARPIAAWLDRRAPPAPPSRWPAA